MAEGGVRQADIDAAGGAQDEIAAQPVEGGVEQDRQHHADADHHQGGDAEIDQHPVDHDLEEDRHRQRQHMHRQRRDHHIAQQGALAPEFRHEPGQAEAAVGHRWI